MHAIAAEATAGMERLPQLRGQLAERDQQLTELDAKFQSHKRKAAEELTAAQAEADRQRDAANRRELEQREHAQRELAALQGQLDQRAAECAQFKQSLVQEVSLRQKVEAERNQLAELNATIQSHKRKAEADLTAAQRERDAARHDLAAASLREGRLRAGMAVLSRPSLLSPLCVDHDAVQCAVRRPCGHAARCADCAEAEIGKQCPACRQTVDAVVRIRMHDGM
jgi:chromosome segregation ATPase